MKRNRGLLGLVVVFLLVIPLAGCLTFGFGQVEGNGQMIGRSFSHDGSITRIVVGNMPVTLNLRPESSREIAYTVDENLVELLDVTYRNGELRIATRNNRSISSDGIVFEIGAEFLNEIVVDGVATIQGDGTFAAETFTLQIDGVARVVLALNAQSVLVGVNGVTDGFVLSGTTEYLYVNIDGVGDIDMRNLIAQHVNVELDGVGSVYVYAETTLNANMDGVGSVTYWGNPELTYTAEGLASVRRGS